MMISLINQFENIIPRGHRALVANACNPSYWEAEMETVMVRGQSGK
jgi:hypothetical protein